MSEDKIKYAVNGIFDLIENNLLTTKKVTEMEKNPKSLKMKINVRLGHTAQTTEVEAVEILKIGYETYYYSDEYSVIITQYKNGEMIGCFNPINLPDYDFWGKEMSRDISNCVFRLPENMKKYIGRSKSFFIPSMKLLIQPDNSFGSWTLCASYEEAVSLYKKRKNK